MRPWGVCSSHQAEQEIEWTARWSVVGKRKVVNEGGSGEHLHVVFPMRAGFDVLLKSHVSEEELCVSVHGSHDVGSGDDVTELFHLVAHCFGSFLAPHLEEGVVDWNAAGGELVKVRFLPLVWYLAGIVWSELTLEWPVLLVLFVSVLIVVSETLDRHISYMFAYLREFGVGGHEVAFVGWDVDVSVVDWLQEVVGVRVSLEGVEGEDVTSIDSVPEELEAH